MSALEVPVLVVGAGPVGMLASLLLAQRGVASRVVERRDGPHRAPQAHVVNPRSLEICRGAGVDMEAIRCAATPASDAASVIWTTALADPPLGRLPFERQAATVPTPTPLLNLSQHRFEPILLERLRREPAAEVCFGTAWESLEQDGDGVRARVRDVARGAAYEVRARYLLAADGAGSRVRSALGIGMGGPDRLASFVMIHFEANLRDVVRDRPAILYWVVHPEHRGTFIAHDIERTWVFMHPYDPERESPEDYDEARCRALVSAAIGGPHPELRVRDRSPWTLAAQVAQRYREGRAFLVGDAAHRFPPTGGLGMNTGLQDAHNLAWKLATVEAGQASRSLLDSYEVERRAVARENSDQSLRNALRLAEVGRALGIDDDAAASVARMEQALADPEGRARVARAIADQHEHFDLHGLHLGFSYEAGAVIPDGSEKPVGESAASDYVPTVRPGSRVPHVWLSRGGERVSTLDLLPYGRFTVVTGPKGGAWAEAAARIRDVRVGCLAIGGDWADPQGAWAAVSGLAPDGALLVRPDQHVAWRAPRLPADPHAALLGALRELLS